MKEYIILNLFFKLLKTSLLFVLLLGRAYLINRKILTKRVIYKLIFLNNEAGNI